MSKPLVVYVQMRNHTSLPRRHYQASLGVETCGTLRVFSKLLTRLWSMCPLLVEPRMTHFNYRKSGNKVLSISPEAVESSRMGVTLISVTRAFKGSKQNVNKTILKPAIHTIEAGKGHVLDTDNQPTVDLQIRKDDSIKQQLPHAYWQ